MKNNKASGLDGIPIEFYKSLFCNDELLETHPAAGKCPLSPILFNLFINDILNDCAKYDVSIGRKECCGGLFADNVVLIDPSAKNLENY